MPTGASGRCGHTKQIVQARVNSENNRCVCGGSVSPGGHRASSKGAHAVGPIWELSDAGRSAGQTVASVTVVGRQLDLEGWHAKT